MNSTDGLQLTLRTAQPSDATAIATLVNSAYRGETSRQGWTTEADLLGGQRTDSNLLAQELAQPGREVLLAYSNENLVGCVSLTQAHDECHLGLLTIRPDLQAAGLGKRLVRAAEGKAREQGCQTMTLSVIQAREHLIAWYERQGYQRTDVVEPFPYGDERFGLPKVKDLSFRLFKKSLV